MIEGQCDGLSPEATSGPDPQPLDQLRLQAAMSVVPASVEIATAPMFTQ